VHHQVAQVGGRRTGTDAAQHRGLSNRWIRAQGRHEQRRKRNRLLILEALPEQWAHTLLGARGEFLEQPGLPNTRWALDDDDTAAARRECPAKIPDNLEFFVAAANRRRHERPPLSMMGTSRRTPPSVAVEYEASRLAFESASGQS
jgi:hypothetical protein